MNNIRILFNCYVVWNFRKYVLFPFLHYRRFIFAQVYYVFWKDTVAKYFRQQSLMLQYWKNNKRAIFWSNSFNNGCFHPTLSDIMSNRARRRYFR